MLTACDQIKLQAAALLTTSFDSNYQPATFADGGRMEKIMQSFPIIDKIFKDYAIQTICPELLMDWYGW
jgi:hypothetical protein